MKSTIAKLTTLAILTTALGCSIEDEAPRTAEAPAAAIATAAAPAPLAPEVLAQLAERYPVLRAERAPEPQPSGSARAGFIPAAVRALPEQVLQTVSGEATFYANKFEGRRTASGIPFRQNQMVAAHRAYPFGTLLRVTNTRNDRSVNVRVVDRGPFGARSKARNTIIDLSRRAAEQLGYIQAGRTPVKVEVLEWGPGLAT